MTRYRQGKKEQAEYLEKSKKKGDSLEPGLGRASEKV